jgi:hypothetical protein
MAQTNWRISGEEFAACNCEWGCPCQFNALPSKGHCTGGLWMLISDGFFGDTQLDGVVWGFMGQWPGAIHEGNGSFVVFIDERASAAQRTALTEIGYGKHSAEGTLFHIMSVVCPRQLEPVIARIELATEPAKRLARVRIADVLEVSGETIRNPVTGDPHFPKLVLPNGFEFKEADFCSSDFKSTAPLKIENRSGHGHFARVAWGPSGYLE